MCLSGRGCECSPNSFSPVQSREPVGGVMAVGFVFRGGNKEPSIKADNCR